MAELDRRSVLAWLGGTALGVGAAGLTGTALAAATQRPEAGSVTVLTGATVVDGTGASPMREAVIVTAGERILAVGRIADIPAIAGVRVIDLGGKFVVPGLWDLHTHSSEVDRTYPPMHLVYGVTGIREMRGTAETHEVRRRIDSGELTGPSMVISSEVLDGPDSRNPLSIPIETEDDARRAVEAATSQGADLIKVYSFMQHHQHAFIARHADRAGLRFGGHSPSPMPVQDVLDNGQHSVEHNYGMHLSTSTRRAEYFAQIAQMPDDAADPGWWGAQVPWLEREALDTYSARLATELADQFAAQGAWHVPTLAVEYATSRHPAQLFDDPRLRELMQRFMPSAIREEWRQWVDAWPPWTPEREALERKYFDAKLEIVGDMADAGGPVVTGTDCGVAFVFPGLAVHDELELLVRAGLSPMRALQAATRDAARCAGQGEYTGTVAAGKRADLVVLDADPLADITTSRRIHAVMARGTYLGPAERRRIFDEIEQVAQTT